MSLVDVWACENRQLDVSDSEHCTDPLEERLRSYCEKVGTSFVSFDGQSGRWVFDVDHFSRYGFLDDDDEEDSENGNVRSTTAVDPSGRVDDSGFSRTGAETVNAADNSVDSRGKNTTPSRVLSVPDDWSDTGEDVEPIEVRRHEKSYLIRTEVGQCCTFGHAVSNGTLNPHYFTCLRHA